MERLLNASGWRKEEPRYVQSPSAQLLISMTSLSSPNPQRHFSPDRPAGMLNEKDVLRGLNERFAGFIQKVHLLESQNRALEQEIEDIREKAKSSCLHKRYEPELQELRMQVHSMSVQKHQIELEHQRLADEFTVLREKCESETRGRTEAEESISALKKYIEQAQRTKQEMDRKANVLEDEIEFLKKNHEAEVAEMLAQMQETQVSSGVSHFGRGELTAALRDIRTQLEGRSIYSVSQTEQRFSSQLAKLTKAAETDRGVLIASKDEIGRFRRQLQEKNVELESARGMREAMEKQLYDLEQRHNAEIHHYQETIRELENELKNTKYDMMSHVHEYQNLLNVKMALDAEIYSYRKLLEGEESRYSTLSHAHLSTPYVYRQSPIYTLPSVTRIGEANRKSEPQYKFVEEIITETTREDIEILETGSDAGKDQEDDKESSNEIADTAAESEQDEKQEIYRGGNAIENHIASPSAEQLEKEKLVDVLLETEEAQNNLNALEFTEEKEKCYNTKINDPSSKVQDPDTETKSQLNITNDAEVAGTNKQDSENEIHQKKPQLNEQKTESVTVEPQTTNSDQLPLHLDPAPKEKQTEKCSQKTHDKKEESEDISPEKTTKTNVEVSKVKLVEIKAPNADSQPGSEKADAEQDTSPKKDSKAEAKGSLAVSTKNNAEKEQKKMQNGEKNLEAKTPLEQVKNESLLESKQKETKPGQLLKKMENNTEIIKTEKDTQSGDEQRKLVDEPKSAMNETEEKESKGNNYETNEQESTEKKDNAKYKQDLDHIEKPKTDVMEEKNEELSEKKTGSSKEGLKTNETKTKTSEQQKEEIQGLALEMEASKQKEKKDAKESKLETSGHTKENKTNDQELDRIAAKDVQLDHDISKTSSKKEKSIDEVQKHKASNELNTETKKSDKAHTGKVKDVSLEVDSINPKHTEENPTLSKDSKKANQTVEYKEKEKETEKKENKAVVSSLEAGTEQKAKNTENGVNA